jgi:acyl carrier protein
MKNIDEFCGNAGAPEITKISKVIAEIFSDHLAIEVPTDTTDLIDEGLLDSLAVVELLLQLERRFGFAVEMEELEIDDLRTVQRIAEYVSRRSN